MSMTRPAHSIGPTVLVDVRHMGSGHPQPAAANGQPLILVSMGVVTPHQVVLIRRPRWASSGHRSKMSADLSQGPGDLRSPY